VNRYDPKYPARCPSCHEEQETQEHMLKCLCINRQTWWENLLQALKGSPGRIPNTKRGNPTIVGRNPILHRPTRNNEPKCPTDGSNNCNSTRSKWMGTSDERKTSQRMEKDSTDSDAWRNKI
jgi:hypothetical protein